jgi:hypothetical protein
MASEMNLKGRTALVTGASSGIGQCLARELAQAGANLVVTARRGDRLEALARDLRSAFGVEVTVLVRDLGTPGAAAELFEATEGEGRRIDVLVNNAGFGTQGRFASIPWEKTAEQLQLNVVTLTELTRRFVEPMLARGCGWILNIGSIGSYAPAPRYATYAAGKAYVRNFTEAVAAELAGTQVRVCCLCPGATRTSFFDVAGQTLPPAAMRLMMSPERCARIGLTALFGGRRNIVAGWTNALAVWVLRFMPRRLVVWVAARATGGG